MGQGDFERAYQQEYEVAMLAAAGLTNKQIGERLFLSHRTVAAHLYQAFPKLGVTSRAVLRDALAPPPDAEPPARRSHITDDVRPAIGPD
jgi:hypothetical protein